MEHPDLASSSGDHGKHVLFLASPGGTNVDFSVVFLIDMCQEPSVFYVRIIRHVYNHAFCSLCGDRSTPSPKANHPYRAIWCFFFQFTVACLFLKMIQQLLTSRSSSSRHLYPSLFLSFNSVFEFAVPMENVTNPIQKAASVI